MGLKGRRLPKKAKERAVVLGFLRVLRVLGFLGV